MQNLRQAIADDTPPRMPAYLYKTRQTEATAEFVAPLLSFSQPDFQFSHVWDSEVPMTPSSETLEMKNTGLLPLGFIVKTQVGGGGHGVRKGSLVSRRGEGGVRL